MKIKRAKGAKAKCDKLFSLIIRSRGACENCGGKEWLQTAHIISRRFSATRTDIYNAFCLDARCHRYFTDHPVEFANFVYEKIGEPMYLAIKLRAESVTKMNWDVELERLKKIWQSIDK